MIRVPGLLYSMEWIEINAMAAATRTAMRTTVARPNEESHRERLHRWSALCGAAVCSSLSGPPKQVGRHAAETSEQDARRIAGRARSVYAPSVRLVP